MTLFRGPDRALFLCAFAIAVLAAAGVEAIAAQLRGDGQWSGPRLRRSLLIAGVVCALLLLVTWGIGIFFQASPLTGPAAATLAAGRPGLG